MSVATIRAGLDDIESSGALRGTPSQWGPKMWGLLDEVMRTIPCHTCRDEGVLMLEGLHDVVNVHRGKSAQRPKALCELARQAGFAAAKSKSCPTQIGFTKPRRFA